MWMGQPQTSLRFPESRSMAGLGAAINRVHPYIAEGSTRHIEEGIPPESEID